MSNRSLFVIAALIIAAGIAPCAHANDVKALLYPLTGEVRLLNPNGSPFSFVYYQIASPSGALNGANGVWTSIADTYDAGGNGFIDPVNQWTELPWSPTLLAEGVFFGSGGVLPAYRSISLGQIWNSSLVMPHDLAVQVIKPSNQNATVAVQLALAGDFNGDLKVDSADYTAWKLAFGSKTAPHADGNHDGVVNAADYPIWRDNFGASLLGMGFGSGSLAAEPNLALSGGNAVPEPASLWLAAGAGGGWLLWWAWSRRRATR